MKNGRAPVVVACLVLAAGTAPPAGAHPLGGFSIDHYSRLQATPQGLRLRYVIDMAEIPAVQELLQADANSDGDISADERQAYLQQKIKDLAAGLAATLNGTPLAWRVDYSNLTAPASVASPAIGTAPSSFRIFLDLHAAFPATLPERNTIRYDDHNYRQRVGWKEVVVEAAQAVQLVKSTAPARDISNELTRYPPDWPAPPQDVAAEFTFELGSEAGLLALARRALPGPLDFVLMAGVLGLGVLVRRRVQRIRGTRAAR